MREWRYEDEGVGEGIAQTFLLLMFFVFVEGMFLLREDEGITNGWGRRRDRKRSKEWKRFRPMELK